jgi:protoporphyrin/coproporphyrin ferrochelatase
MTAVATRHVVLVTYGEPPTASFLDQLAYSWRILLGLTRKVDAIPRPLLPVIALARARGRRQLWRRHQYASPLEPVTERQMRVMSSLLGSDAPAIRWRAHVAYEYRAPLLTDLVAALPQDEPVCVVPMYAAESAFTHALSREAVASRPGPVYVLDALSPEALADASAAHVLSMTAEGGWSGPDVALVLAAHGTVLDPPKPIDTGRKSTEALCSAIASRLSSHFGLVVNGWLNHTRGGRWTEPPIEAALARVQAAGFSRVVYFPYGFLADNAESELEGRIALSSVADLEARHLPCLNDSPELMAILAEQIRQLPVG